MKKTRLITGSAIFIVMGTLGCIQGVALRVALMGMTCLSMWEMYNALSAKGMKPARWVGMVYALLALPILLLYSGKRGKANLKYFFYIFYPVHLAALQGIAMLVR